MPKHLELCWEMVECNLQFTLQWANAPVAHKLQKQCMRYNSYILQLRHMQNPIASASPCLGTTHSFAHFLISDFPGDLHFCTQDTSANNSCKWFSTKLWRATPNLVLHAIVQFKYIYVYTCACAFNVCDR